MTPSSPVPAEAERTAAEWSDLLGDDIAYWMGNPFLDAELRADKVAWWLNCAAAAVVSSPATPAEDGARCASRSKGYHCTRDAGHAGWHEYPATGGFEIWNDSTQGAPPASPTGEGEPT